MLRCDVWTVKYGRHEVSGGLLPTEQSMHGEDWNTLRLVWQFPKVFPIWTWQGGALDEPIALKLGQGAERGHDEMARRR